VLLPCHIQRESLPPDQQLAKVMAAQTFSSALEQLNKARVPIPGSSAAAHAFKIAKRTQFRTHLSVTYVLDRRREIPKSVSHELRRTIWHNVTASVQALYDVIGTRKRPVAWLSLYRHSRSRR
jgi:hypothetical protein